jgi:hypothetical protein
MNRTVPTLLLLACVGLVPAAAGRSGRAHGQSVAAPTVPDDDAHPMQVLGDTPEYCAQLERIIARQPNRPAEVRELVIEGHRMCDHGQVRVGILYMRRALMILRHKPLIMVQP